MLSIMQLIVLAQEFTDLGWAVQGQLKDAAAGVALPSMSANALGAALDWLRSVEAHGVADDVVDLRQQIEDHLTDRALREHAN